MIKHAITVVMKVVEHLNPGQTAVNVFDQPLFALAKEIQWRHPDTMGDDRVVIMLGGLHIELAVLKADFQSVLRSLSALMFVSLANIRGKSMLFVTNCFNPLSLRRV